MLRTWLAIVVLASAGGLAGCGGGDDSSSGASAQATTQASAPPATTPVEEPATTTTAAAGATGTPGATGSTGSAAPTAEEQAFGRDFDRRCTSFKALFASYTKRFQSGLPDDPDAVVRLFRSRTTKLLTELRGFYRGLASVDAPAGYETFSAGLDRLVPQVERKVDRAERIVDGIKTIEDVRDDAKKVQSALSSVSEVSYPPAFRTLAPACLDFG